MSSQIRRGYVEPELMVHIDQYLTENRDKAYIDIDDMIEKLRSKSYRYSRMKKYTFTSMVKDAYDQYCKQNDTAEDPDGHPQADTDDSDIEEIQNEEEPPPNRTMPNLLSSLYSTPTSTIKIPKDIKITIPGRTRHDTEGEGGSDSNQSFQGRLDSTQNISKGAADSSTTTEKVAEDKGNDSEDDLEIIDYVQPPPPPPGTHENAWGLNGASNPVVATTQTVVLKPIPNTAVNSKTAMSSSVIQEAGNHKEKAKTPTSPEKNGPFPGLTLLAKKKEIVSSASMKSPIKEPPSYSKGGEGPRSSVKRSIHDTIVAGDADGLSSKEKKLKRDLNEKNYTPIQSSHTFSDFGGGEHIIEEICKLLMHLRHPEIYESLGVSPPRGFLLHGPPGCGKTLLANAIAGELKLPMLKMVATELISGISGESENNIRNLFEQAQALAPCIIFIDEIDSITPKRENAQREMERRIVAQLIACIDDLGSKEKNGQILLIGATNRLEAIDTALRRAGRFDREICLGIPDEKTRNKILRIICKNLRVGPDFDYNHLARSTPGYVGADLHSLIREAVLQAVNVVISSKMTKVLPDGGVETEEKQKEVQESGGIGSNEEKNEQPMEVDAEAVPRKGGEPGKSPEKPSQTLEKEEGVEKSSEKDKILEEDKINENEVKKAEPDSSGMLKWINEISPISLNELTSLYVKMEDFEKALKNVQPSAKREGFATVPDVTWDDIGALQAIRDELQVSILGPVKHAESFRALGLDAPGGVLLCGPPGCGKTLLAKAVANEAGINFISVKGPELLNMYVGESERAVRQCFSRAKNSAPCVIFFDELDSLCPKRSEGPELGSASRVVNQLLTEMDGIESRLGVFVMGATNRPDIIDPAILRPGRLDKILFVDLPTVEDRLDIMKTITRKLPKLGGDVDLEEIVKDVRCESYTGADLASLVREASIAAFREFILAGDKPIVKDADLRVYKRHFDVGFTKTKPSVSKKDQIKYDNMKTNYSSNF